MPTRPFVSGFVRAASGAVRDRKVATKSGLESVLPCDTCVRAESGCPLLDCRNSKLQHAFRSKARSFGYDLRGVVLCGFRFL